MATKKQLEALAKGREKLAKKNQKKKATKTTGSTKRTKKSGLAGTDGKYLTLKQKQNLIKYLDGVVNKLYWYSDKVTEHTQSLRMSQIVKSAIQSREMASRLKQS